MAYRDIPVDEAELLSILLESLLYGFSLLMFGGTIWVLFVQRATSRVNYTMVMIACTLLLLSTTHLVIHIIRVMSGLIFFRDTYPGGPIGFFADPSQWTFVAKTSVYTAQTLIGDGVAIYRCYAVWQSKLVMILPVLLWCGLAVTGIASPYILTQPAALFNGTISQWATSFWAMVLPTNLVATSLLAFRIWYVDNKTQRLHGHRQSQSQLRPILHIILDAGVIYSLAVFIGLICFVSKTNGQFVILDMVTPIISITFYMVIIRVGISKHSTSRSATSIPLGYTTSQNGDSAERRRALQVHVSKLTESTVDNYFDQRSPSYKTIPVSSHEDHPTRAPSPFQFEGEGKGETV